MHGSKRRSIASLISAGVLLFGAAGPTRAGELSHYERSGGFAGTMQTYEIYADGRTVIRDGDTEIETRVSPNDVQTALTRIEELGFFDLAAPLGPVSA